MDRRDRNSAGVSTGRARWRLRQYPGPDGEGEEIGTAETLCEAQRIAGPTAWYRVYGAHEIFDYLRVHLNYTWDRERNLSNLTRAFREGGCRVTIDAMLVGVLAGLPDILLELQARSWLHNVLRVNALTLNFAALRGSRRQVRLRLVTAPSHHGAYRGGPRSGRGMAIGEIAPLNWAIREQWLELRDELLFDGALDGISARCELVRRRLAAAWQAAGSERRLQIAELLAELTIDMRLLPAALAPAGGAGPARGRRGRLRRAGPGERGAVS